MTPEEKDIMADMFYYLRDHDSPPSAALPDCQTYWENAATDICKLVSGKWRNHPLATQLGIAVLNYLESKGGDTACGG